MAKGYYPRDLTSAITAIHYSFMAQLLVRKVDSDTVRKLKERARAHGVSAEEEHRRILLGALTRAEERQPTLMEFLLSPEGRVGPEVDLELDRSKSIETRNIGF